MERNADMIDKSDVCIFYYDENYLPPRRKNAKRAIADYQPKSGTKIAYDYAQTKKKKYNLYLQIEICVFCNVSIKKEVSTTKWYKPKCNRFL